MFIVEAGIEMSYLFTYIFTVYSWVSVTWFARRLENTVLNHVQNTLSNLLKSAVYNPSKPMKHKALAFIFIPCIQRELDNQKNIHNHQRIKIPLNCANEVGGIPCGKKLSKSDIKELSDKFSNKTANNFYMKGEDDLADMINSVLPKPREELTPEEAAESFIAFKKSFGEWSLPYY